MAIPALFIPSPYQIPSDSSAPLCAVLSVPIIFPSTANQKNKMNIEIQDRIDEIKQALQALCLGSIEHVVIDAAVNELIQNWEDHQ